MQMKKKFFMLISLLFVACAAFNANRFDNPNLRASVWTQEYYREWGILKVTGSSLWNEGHSMSQNEIVNLIKEDKFCARFVLNVSETYAERIFLNDSGEISFECLSNSYNLFEDEMYGMFGSLDNTKQKIPDYERDDFQVRLFYKGDSLDLNLPQQKKDSIYELFFSLDAPVYTIAVRMNPNNLKGYKPLKLDPSILPLESPKYKALREYEESIENSSAVRNEKSN